MAISPYVILTDIDENGISLTCKELRQRSLKARCEHLDVTDLNSVKIVVEKVIEQEGCIDILVNNAGILRVKPFLEVMESDWNQILDINLKGIYYCTSQVAKYMVQQGYGRIINVASQLGLVGSAERSVYTTSKGGVIQLTRSLSLEFASKGILVNAIAPGPVKTNLTSYLLNDAERYKSVIEKIPLGRLAEPEEISGAVVFLCSEAASYITGQVLVIDGGWTAQ